MLLLIIAVGYIFHPVFAANSADPSFLDSLAGLLTKSMKIGSRAWIPLATLAGKFMSNDMIYGSRLHLDSYLWQIRNISKNFANFWILWFLLFEIIKSIGKKGGVGELGKVVSKAVVAGIVIQMSWFLVGSIVDISTIATTAVGSFPASFLASSSIGGAMDTRIEQTVKKGTITLDESAYPNRSAMEIADDETTAQTREKFMPKYDSIAGPLVYIGASALGIQDMMTIKSWENQDAKSILVTFGLKAIILLFYIVILALLLVANIIRIGYLWVFIGISPILVLMSVFLKRDKSMWGGKFLGQLSIKWLITMVFKPTLFVGVLGLILIFVASIQSVLLSSPNINGTTITQTANGSKIEIEGVASISTTEKVLSDIGNSAQSIIPNLIVYLATIFLLRVLVKVSLWWGKNSTDPIWSLVDNWMWFVKDAAKKTNFGGYSYDSLTQKSGGFLWKTTDTITKWLFWDNASFNTSSWAFTDESFEDSLDAMRWTIKWWSADDFKHLWEAANAGWDFIGETNNRILRNGSRFGSNDDVYKQWRSDLGIWLEKAKIKEKYGIKATTVEWLEEPDWKIIHEKLGWLSIKDKAPTNEEEFRKIKYKGASTPPTK